MNYEMGISYRSGRQQAKGYVTGVALILVWQSFSILEILPQSFRDRDSSTSMPLSCRFKLLWGGFAFSMKQVVTMKYSGLIQVRKIISWITQLRKRRLHLQHVMEELLAIAVPLKRLVNVEIQHAQRFHFIVGPLTVLQKNRQRGFYVKTAQMSLNRAFCSMLTFPALFKRTPGLNPNLWTVCSNQ